MNGKSTLCPRVSFVIPAKNEEKEIGVTLSAILGHKWACVIEVIVVDNDSQDRTAEVAQLFGARVLQKRGGTIAATRNYGVSCSSGEILIFLDADVSLTPSWFEEIYRVLSCMQDNPWLITGSHCVVPENSHWLVTNWFGSFSQSDATTHLGTGHLLVTKRLFTEIGGFDASLRTGEDYEFCSRAKAHGAVIINNPQLKVVHRDYPKTLLEFVKREAWHGIGDVGSFSKVFSSKVAVMALVFLFSHMLMAAPLLTTAVPPVVSGIGSGILAFILLGSSVFKFRHAGPSIVITNSCIFYFYYLGRLISFFRIVSPKK